MFRFTPAEAMPAGVSPAARYANCGWGTPAFANAWRVTLSTLNISVNSTGVSSPER